MATVSPAAAQSAENVAVVINDASPASQKIAEYYIKRRGIPATNVIRIRTVTTEDIERPGYLSTIEQPVAAALSRNALQDRILYIVLTKGIPLRVRGTAGTNGTYASVDSELTVLYTKMTGRPVPVSGPFVNPFYLDTRPVREARPFSHRDHQIYLVTRLDAFTVDEVLQLIDRAQSPVSDGSIVLDQRAGLSDQTADEWLAEAARRIQDQGQGSRVALNTSMSSAPPADRVLGYYSWGSNDPANRKRQFGMRFVPGAIAATFVSSDARTFNPPPNDWVPSGDWNNARGLFAGSPQTLIGDLIREGATGVAGHVAEPYLRSAIKPEILFPAYLAGFNLAESFYLAMPNLSWQTVVIGDPLCRPFPRPLLTRSDIEDPPDAQTELPAIFSRRRMEMVRAVLKDVSDKALPLLLASEARQARGDTAGMRAALEKATAVDADIAAAQLQLATIYDGAGEPDKAIERYRIVLKMQPRNVLALNNLAYALAVRKNSPAEALPFAERAITLAPQDPNVLDTVGWIQHLNGNSREAAKVLADAVRRAPNVAEIRLHAAFVNAAIGSLAPASAELNEALRLNPALGKRPDVVQLQRKLNEKRQ
jgi:uncharacterized protein (TIGR03790 family)